MEVKKHSPTYLLNSCSEGHILVKYDPKAPHSVTGSQDNAI